MMNLRPNRSLTLHRSAAFSLVELLTVIGIIAILAGIIMGASMVANHKRIRMNAEGQLRALEHGVEAYYLAFNSYPPDNPTNSIYNPLFYELSGTIYDPGTSTFSTVGRNDALTSAEISSVFGIDGFQNGSDDRTKVKGFGSFRAEQDYQSVRIASGRDVELMASVFASTNMINGSKRMFNPWHYYSGTNVVQNTGKYDLWLDLTIGNTFLRVNNWER